MATEKTITNLRGPAARIVQTTGEMVPAGAGFDVEMTGPDQGRKFHFKVERGLPGVNAVENDTAVAAYLGAVDSDSRAALDQVLREQAVPLSIMKPVPQPPTGFRGLLVLPMPTIRRTVGRFVVDENVFEQLRPAGGGIYYSAPGAPSGATGTSPSAPRALASLTGSVPNGATIVLADGEYYRHEAALPATLTKSLRLVPATGAKPKLTGFERPTDLSWTNTTGHIYQTTRTATVSVLDTVNLDAGDYTRYEQKPDLVSIGGPGQFAIVGSTVYVWSIGNTNLVANSSHIRLQISSRGGLVITGQGNVAWAEGIEFLGCGSTSSGSFMGGLVADGGAIIVNKDCVVAYNTVDGPAAKGGGHLVSIRAEVKRNGLDGFSYHNTATAGGTGEFIEIDCHSHDNGLTPGAVTNNPSTAHEAYTGVRVGGLYDRFSGPGVADVNSAQSWNLGCHAGGPAQPIPESQDQSWRADGAAQIDGAGPAKMWLDECTADGALYAIRTSNGSEINIHAFGYSNPNGAYAGSIVANYSR